MVVTEFVVKFIADIMYYASKCTYIIIVTIYNIIMSTILF